MSRHASRTALATAYIRAAHQLFDPPPRILDDPIAVPLLGPDGTRRLEATADRHETASARALRAHVVLRSRLAEDRLAAAVERGVAQYVILGAGFDTFAFRQPGWAQRLRIAEVDHAASQAAKRARLAAAGIAIPANVLLADVDLAHESLPAALRRHGVALDAPTFFSWLGVTMYLPEAAIDVVLEAVACFPPGTELVLTFSEPRASERPSPLAERVARVGEPFVSAFSPDAMAAKLRAAGFSGVELPAAAEVAARYFRPPVALPVPERTGIACAIR